MNKLRVSLIVIAIVAAFAWFKGCFKSAELPQFNLPLTEDTTAQVAITDRTVAIRTKKTTKASYVPEGGTAIVTVKTDGAVNLHVQSAGFTVRPELGLLITNQARGVVGLQLAYWNRLELHAGLAYPNLVGWAGVGYRLDSISWLRNTSAILTYMTDKAIGGGLVVRF